MLPHKSQLGWLQSSEDDEDAKKLIRDIRSLKKRCQLLEAETDALGATNSELQTVVSDRDDQLERQRYTIQALEATIHDQSSDIRTALQLVSPQARTTCIHTLFGYSIYVWYNSFSKQYSQHGQPF